MTGLLSDEAAVALPVSIILHVVVEDTLSEYKAAKRQLLKIY